MAQFEQCEARELLDEAAAALDRACIENPRLDAELILAKATGRSRAEVLFTDFALDALARQKFATMVERRRQREPLAYIVGHKEFYSIDLEITPAVLIPRPETEFVVSEALRILADRKDGCVLDLCAGSGAIALAIAANAAHVQVVATDRWNAALQVARRNAERLGLIERIAFRQADVFDPIDSGGPLGRFDLIVSNPPYIRDADIPALQPEVARWEPHTALSGGPDGLDFYRRIARGLATHLEDKGCVVVEVGELQADAVMKIFRESGIDTLATIPDLSGVPRVVSAQALPAGRPPSIR